MPEIELTGEKIEIHAFQTAGDVDTLLGYTSGDVNVEATVDILEAEVHDKRRKLRKPGKEAVDLTFGGVITSTIPALAKLNLATGTPTQTIVFSGVELVKVVVKVFERKEDVNPKHVLTLNAVIPILEGFSYHSGDFATFQLRGIINGDVQVAEA